MKSRPRFPELKKGVDGKYLCRGCGGAVPKGRQTWCSQKCHKEKNPFYVKQAVEKRAKECCEFCGKDCSWKAISAHGTSRPVMPLYQNCNLPYPYEYRLLYAHPLYRAYVSALKEWKEAAPVGEFDHIIPHSEGGDFTLENIRLLCRACHKERTATWHRERAEARKQKVQPGLI